VGGTRYHSATGGVDSNHGSRYDGFQFAGWKSLDNKKQWNSCTSKYPPPDPFRYNYDGYTTQFTTEGPRIYAQWWLDELPWPCSDYGTIFTFMNYFMVVWELDWPDSDDHVATLTYPSFSTNLSGGGGYWWGESAWVNPSSVTGPWGNNMTANMDLIRIGGQVD
jgi:hypothetical protein